MSLIMRAAEINGRPVVTLDTAEDIAEVRDVVFSHSHGELSGFTLNKRGWLAGPRKEELAWADVAALGPDAVMVASAEALRRPGDDGGVAAGGGDSVIGGRVITDDGNELGEVTDLVVSVDDGAAQVVGYEIGGPRVEDADGADLRYIPLPETFAVSGAALIVPASVTGFIRDDLSGFGSAVDDFRAQLEDG